MQNEIVIKSLRSLIENVTELDETESKIKKAENDLIELKNKPFIAVADFDKEYKECYIASKIGTEPQKPSKALIIAVPVYLKNLKEYKEKLQSYKKTYKIFEDDYYEKNRETRNKLEKEEQEERNIQIKSAEKILSNLHKRYTSLKKIIDNETIVSNSLKKVDTLQMLLSFFEEDRVDNIREAVNLLYEEEHRKQTELLLKQQLELINSVKSLAEDAQIKSSEAMERADDAYYLADRAYEMARDAYDLAESTDSED